MSPGVQSSKREKTHSQENPSSVAPHLSKQTRSFSFASVLIIIPRNRANRVYVDKQIKRRFNVRIDSPWLWRLRSPMICHLPAGEPLKLTLIQSACKGLRNEGETGVNPNVEG